MIEINGEKSVTLTAEAYLELEVEYKGKKPLLNGKSDYSVWYDDRGMSTNLVICEAKKLDGVSGGLAQCLGYMGKLFPSITTVWLPCHISCYRNPDAEGSNYLI